METNTNTDSFNELQSLRVIQEMISVSQKKLKNNGVLFILWGWISFFNLFILNYITSSFVITHSFKQVVNTARIILPVAGVIFTLIYIFKQRKKAQTYIGISLRYVWTSLIVCLVLLNLILFNILDGFKPELQHPIYMVIIAFAITITGGILRYRLIIGGGIIFGMLALLASHFEIKEQILIEAIAWLIAFIIPGHILYSKRKS